MSLTPQKLIVGTSPVPVVPPVVPPVPPVPPMISVPPPQEIKVPALSF